MKRKILVSLACILAAIGVLSKVYLQNDEVDKVISEAENIIINEINTYEMTQEEIQNLSSTEIVEQTEEQENAQEQEVESEGFELQGQIAYEGDKARTWNVELGDYKGLTYYSQIDKRWSSNSYTSCGNSSQTIGSSGCAPTTASMIVTATKGAITPDTMSDLFVKYRL